MLFRNLKLCASIACIDARKTRPINHRCFISFPVIPISTSRHLRRPLPARDDSGTEESLARAVRKQLGVEWLSSPGSTSSLCLLSSRLRRYLRVKLGDTDLDCCTTFALPVGVAFRQIVRFVRRPRRFQTSLNKIVGQTEATEVPTRLGCFGFGVQV